jgi:uncharacterized membrane protein (DUF2068 family)
LPGDRERSLVAEQNQLTEQLPGLNLFLSVERWGGKGRQIRMHVSENGLIRLIAFFKLVKASLLIITGVALLKIKDMNPGAELEYWVTNLGLDPGSRFINHAIQRATEIPPHRIKELGIATFIYAALFLTEGIGLWMLKRWAEWFTVIATGSLIPIECYEIYRHPSAIKIIVLLINILVVVYLVYRIRHRQAGSRESGEPGPAAARKPGARVAPAAADETLA